MKKIDDPRLADILEFQDSEELSGEVIQHAYRKARLLLACRSWNDVTFVVDQLMKMPSGYAVPLSGKWALLFRWDDENFAYGLQLRRL